MILVPSKKNLWVIGTGFLQASCPSCNPARSAKAQDTADILCCWKNKTCIDIIHMFSITLWILYLCNGIVKEGCIPEDCESSVVLPIYKVKGDPMECGSYRGIKLLEHAMKVVERIIKDRIQQQIDIDDMQFGFMKGKGTTDAILLYDRCRRSLELKLRNSVLVLCVWKKLLIGFREK